MTNEVSGKTGNQGGFASSLPRIPSTVELYDLLMREIEPELLSTSIAGLALKYRRETPEQSNERAERYAKAFREYDRRLETYIQTLNASIRKFGKDAAASMEALSSALTSIDSTDTTSHTSL